LTLGQFLQAKAEGFQKGAFCDTVKETCTHRYFHLIVCLLFLSRQQKACPFTTHLRVLKLVVDQEAGPSGINTYSL
jgi:hypothetical protein